MRGQAPTPKRTPRLRYARHIVAPSHSDGFTAPEANSLSPPSMIECCVAAPGLARASSRQRTCLGRCNIAHRTVNTKPQSHTEPIVAR